MLSKCTYATIPFSTLREWRLIDHSKKDGGMGAFASLN